MDDYIHVNEVEYTDINYYKNQFNKLKNSLNNLTSLDRILDAITGLGLFSTVYMYLTKTDGYSITGVITIVAVIAKLAVEKYMVEQEIIYKRQERIIDKTECRLLRKKSDNSIE